MSDAADRISLDALPTSLDEMRRRLHSLANPQQLLEEIFGAAPVGLQIYRRDGRCVLVNPRHTELFGGVPPPDYNVFEDTLLIESGVATLVQRAFLGERVVVPPIWYDIRELRNVEIKSGGRRFAVSAELVPLRSAATGQVEHVLFVFHDVTEAHEARERAEAAAREALASRTASDLAAKQSAFLAEAGRVLSASLDYEFTLRQLARLATPTLADFCIVDVVAEDGSLRRVAASHADPAAQPTLDELCRKYPPFIGSPQPAMVALTSRMPELLSDVDPAVVASHTTSAEHERLLLKLGVRSHLAVPLLLGERALGTISLAYVGDRRYRRADVPLVEALASRAAVAIENARLFRDAELARAESESANRAKDQFLAMLGHELRNPLAPIVTALELMRLRDGPSDERHVIERQVTHVRRLVDDLLDVARITRGRLELAREPIELSVALKEGIELARPLVEARRHVLTVACPERGFALLGDRVRLAQVIANLLNNAARYTPPGGRIDVRAERHGDEVVLRVSDSGVGMTPELLPRVFDLFAQGEQTLERASGGLGLGLSIVKSLVELHGGRVRAESAGRGSGSLFEITLPAERDLVAGRASEPPAPFLPARGDALVLIVDDNEDAAALLAQALERRGYRTLVAHDAAEALALVHEQKPDLGLLDIGLPGMDGYELARRLRDGELGGCPLVALTGYGQAGDRARSEAAGFSRHLVKPVDTRELERVMLELLARTPDRAQ